MYARSAYETRGPIKGTDQRPLPAKTTLLARHVNDVAQDNGTLHDLYKVEPGALVYVADPAGAVTRWRVVGLDVAVKAALPKWMLAGPEGPRKLALVTRGGPSKRFPGSATRNGTTSSSPPSRYSAGAAIAPARRA